MRSITLCFPAAERTASIPSHVVGYTHRHERTRTGGVAEAMLSVRTHALRRSASKQTSKQGSSASPKYPPLARRCQIVRGLAATATLLEGWWSLCDNRLTPLPAATSGLVQGPSVRLRGWPRLSPSCVAPLGRTFEAASLAQAKRSEVCNRDALPVSHHVKKPVGCSQDSILMQNSLH